MSRLILKCALLFLFFASSVSKADTVSQWLKQMGCDNLRAMYLEEQLGSGVQKKAAEGIAQELAEIYTFMLGKATDGSEDDILSRTNALIESWPGVIKNELKLQLYRVTYFSAELLLEKYRLRLISRSQADEAIEILRDTLDQLSAIRTPLDKKAMNPKTFDETDRSQLALATSLSGWANYYLAWHLKDEELAEKAASLFAKILGAEAPKSVQAVSWDLRMEEYGATALLGIALSKGVGSVEVSDNWFEGLDDDQTWHGVRSQLLAYKIAVCIDHQRWGTVLEMLKPEEVSDPRILQLIAVRGLEQRTYMDADEASKIAIERLIDQSELETVSKIVIKYNLQHPAVSGFISAYIHGEFKYRNLRAEYPSDNPSTDTQIQAKFDDACDLFNKAIESSDADQYPLIKDDCIYSLGLAQFYSGKFIDAGNTFYNLGKRTNTEKALWMVMVSFGSIDLINSTQQKKLQESLKRYCALWPNSVKTTQLKLRFNRDIPSLSTVEELLKIQPSDPNYETVQREIVQKLYQAWSLAESQNKELIGKKYISTVLPLIFSDVESAASSDVLEKATMQSLRALEIALDKRVKRLVAAKQILDLLDRLFSTLPNLKRFENEITYRSIVYCLLTQQFELAIQKTLTAIQASPKDLWVNRAANYTWDVVVGHVSGYTNFQTQYDLGAHILSNYPDAELETARYHLVATKVVRAALAKYSGQPSLIAAPNFLDVLAIARKLVVLYPKDETCLELAAESEAAFGDKTKAMKYWGVIVDSTERSSVEWLRAKYQLIQLMAEEDQAKAMKILDQHQVLYPLYGSEPYGSKLKNLHNQLRGTVNGS